MKVFAQARLAPQAWHPAAVLGVAAAALQMEALAAAAAAALGCVVEPAADAAALAAKRGVGLPCQGGAGRSG